MNRTPRLSKSGIEYLTHCWNFYSGCLNSERGICPLGEDCWAKGITVRFPDHYPNGFEPTYYPEAFLSPLHLKKPSIIGVAFMGDLFGDWVDPDKQFILPERREGWIDLVTLRSIVFQVIEACPQHRFLFLTKCPWNLPKWSPFPEHCYVGVTATNRLGYSKGISELRRIEAKVKFISFEPLLERIELWDSRDYLLEAGIGWLIIGAQTKPYKPPKIEWVEEIVMAADKASIPVFLKDNLKPLIHKERRVSDRGWLKYYEIGEELRQELPK